MYLQTLIRLFLPAVLLLLVSVKFGDLSSDADLVAGDPSSCARVYFRNFFQGMSIVLKDREQVPYLNDFSSWENTSSVSFKTNPTCVLTIASGPRLTGELHSFSEDTNRYEDISFQNSSLFCKCQKVC